MKKKRAKHLARPAIVSLLCAVLLLSLMPFAALADTADPVQEAEIPVTTSVAVEEPVEQDSSVLSGASDVSELVVTTEEETTSLPEDAAKTETTSTEIEEEVEDETEDDEEEPSPERMMMRAPFGLPVEIDASTSDVHSELTDALQSAADGDDVVVVFADDLGGSITLTSPLTASGNASGSLTFQAPADFEIKNATSRHLVLDSTGDLTIDLGGVTLSGAKGGIEASGEATVKNGTVTGSTLSGVRLNAGANLTLEKVFVIENTCIAGTLGAGVYVAAGAVLTMQGGEISRNTIPSGSSAKGAGMYLLGTARLTGVTIADNSNVYYEGGGIYAAEGSVLEMVDSSLIANTSSGGGGLYAIKAAKISITGDGVIQGNYANPYAGGADILGCDEVIISVDFIDNTARTDAGGLRLLARLSGTTSGTVEAPLNAIITSNFTGNRTTGTSTNMAGALYVSNPGGSFSLSNLSFTDNSANYVGGAIYVTPNTELILHKVDFTDNAVARTGSFGGAIGVGSNGSITATNCTFTNNRTGTGSSYGGAICSFPTATNNYNVNLNLKNCNFDDNYASLYGGAIFTGGAVTIEGGGFTNNGTTVGGGAIFMNTTAQPLTILGAEAAPVVFTDNYTGVIGGSAHSSGNNGGAINSSSKTVLEYVDFIGNFARQYGGAVSLESTDNTIENCNFIDNTAERRGGAVYLPLSQALEIKNSRFEGNEAVFDSVDASLSGRGGAIFIGASTATDLTLTNTAIDDNTAEYQGAGIYFSSVGDKDTSHTLIVNGGSISGNTAPNGGGALWLSYTDATFTNVVIDGNSSSFGGGAMLSSGYITLAGNTVVTNNTNTSTSTSAGTGGGAINLMDNTASDFGRLTVGPDVVFNKNYAANGVFELTDTTLIALHDSKVETDKFSLYMPYAYNNYDVYSSIGTREYPITVTYDVNDAGGANFTELARKNHPFDAPEDPVHSDGLLLFDVWHNDASAEWDFANHTSDVDLTLTAQWREDITFHTVAFYMNDGTADEYASVEAVEDQPVDKPTDPERTGYNFTGWFTDPDCALADEWDFDGLITAPLDLYAGWSAKQFTMSFRADADTAPPADRLVTYGTTTTEPAAPGKTGHSFVAWFTDEAGGTAWNFATQTMPANNVTLYARYTVKDYFVTYDFGTGETKKQQTTYNTALMNLQPSARPGYSFKGWIHNGQLWNFATGLMPAYDITLNAVWEADEVVTTTPQTSSPATSTPSSSSRRTGGSGGTATSTPTTTTSWYITSSSSSTSTSSSQSSESPSVAASEAPAPSTSTAPEPEETSSEAEVVVLDVDDSLGQAGLLENGIPMMGILAVGDNWGVSNVLLLLVMVAFAIFAILRGNRTAMAKVWRTLTIALGFAAIPVFFFTQDLTKPMGFVDAWSILMVGMLAAQVVCWIVQTAKGKAQN